MRRALVCLLLATSLSAPALALEVPRSDDTATTDPNVKVVAYKPLQRVLIVGMVERSTTITFGQSETIKRVEFGDQANPSWIGPDPKAGPLKNNLILWPTRAGRTDLQVITALADGTERLYQYELVAKGAAPDANTTPDLTFGLVYTYPADVRAAQVQAWKARQIVLARKTAEDRLATDFWYGRSNYDYEAHGKPGSAAIAPLRVRDNGRLTGFQYPGTMRMPAVYTGRCDGKAEHLVATTAQNDWLVAQATAPVFCLRLGDRALEVINKAYDPIGQNPGTGTVSPDVVREIVAKD